MQIKAVKEGVNVQFTSGDSMVVGVKPVMVPPEYEAEVRRSIPNLYGVDIVQEPKPKAKTDESVEKKGGA